MKKIISFIMTIVLTLSLIGGVATAAPKTPVVKVNNKTVVFDTKPYTTKNNLMVPVRQVAEMMGASVKSIGHTQEVCVVLGNNKIMYKLNTSNSIVNGAIHTMNDKVLIKNKRTYVPAKFLVEKLGGTYKWDYKNRIATITVKTLKPPAKETAIIPKAKTPFKPYIPELTPIDPKTLAELKKYPDNKKTSWPNDSNYESNQELVKRIGIEQTKELACIAKGYVQTQYNVDYRNVDENYVKQLKYFFMPGTFEGIQGIIKNYAESLIKYKVIAKCDFITDTSLVYTSRDNIPRIRGRLEMVFTSANDKFFTENNMPKMQLNKKYFVDIEIGIVQLFGQEYENWEHSKYCFTNSVELSSYTVMRGH